jgi:hypothetical protein
MQKTLILLQILVLVCGVAVAKDPEQAATKKFPVIACADLFHPYGDDDDQIDNAVMFAMSELDMKAVVLDFAVPGYTDQTKNPGGIPLSQLNILTGRNVPFAAGLSSPLKDPLDKGLDQPRGSQLGIYLLLNSLQQSDRKVTITITGAATNVAAAMNRDFELFKSKVDKIMLFAGEASDVNFREHNVECDRKAFVRVMTSDLPVYWIPCFDGGYDQAKFEPHNNGHASVWKCKYSDIIRPNTPHAAKQYFAYCLTKSSEDPLEYLRKAEDANLQTLWDREKMMFCSSIFPFISDRQIVFDGKDYHSVPLQASTKLTAKKMFGFSPIDVQVSNVGTVTYGKSADSHRVMRFDVLDKNNYAKAMTDITAELITLLKN